MACSAFDTGFLLHNISYYHFTTQDLICGEIEMRIVAAGHGLLGL
jgi:hypothetical protein